MSASDPQIPASSDEPLKGSSKATGTPSAIHRIVAIALRQRFLILLVAVLLIGGGVFSFKRLPVDAYPDLSPPIVEIVTQWDGHAAEEVERLITVPVEVEMNGLPGQTVVRSISLYGLSSVRITFNRGTDNYFARQQVFERLPDLSLPSGVTPSVSPLFSPSGLIYRYVLESPDRTPTELKTIEDWIVERQYKSVPGVADDSGLGGPTMQYQVLLDPAKIAGAGLSIPAVVTALGANNDNAGAASTRKAGSSTTCAGSAASRLPRTSATSCSPSTTASRCWSRTSARWRSARRRASASSASTTGTRRSKA